MGHYRTVVARYRDEEVFADYIDSVGELLAERDTVLIAESFSGPIALALMAKFPCRIRCAVLCATFVVSPFRALTRLASFMPTAMFTLHPLQRAILSRFCLDDKCSPELMKHALSVIRSVPARTIQRRLEVLSSIDMRPSRSRIETPVLILRAMQDRLVSRTLYQQLIDALPNSKVCDVAGPHLLLQTRPRECARAILEFTNG